MVGVGAVVGSGDGSACVVLLMGLCVWLCVALLMGLCVWRCNSDRWLGWWPLLVLLMGLCVCAVCGSVDGSVCVVL